MPYKSIYDRPISYDTWEYTYYLYLRNITNTFSKYFPEDREYFENVNFQKLLFKLLYKRSSKKICDTDKDEEYINFFIQKNGL